MTRKPNGAHPVDIHVGAEIARRRILGGYNQSDLGRALGLTFQQVQKYEKGANRVSASKLHATADFLGCDIADFFPAKGATTGEAAPGFFTIRGAPMLAKAFERLPQNRRTLLLALAAELLPDDDEATPPAAADIAPLAS